MDELQPGPPFSHNIKGASSGLDLDSKNLRMRISMRIDQIKVISQHTRRIDVFRQIHPNNPNIVEHPDHKFRVLQHEAGVP